MSLHNLHHLFSNELFMGSFGVACSFNLLWSLFGKSNTEHSKNETIGSLGLDEGFNERMPLFDHWASIISCDVHSVKISVAVKALNLVNLELHLSPGVLFSSIVAVSEGEGKNTTSQTIGRVCQTSSFVTWGQSNTSLVEAGSKHVVPFLSWKWMSSIKSIIKLMSQNIFVKRKKIDRLSILLCKLVQNKNRETQKLRRFK